MSRAPRARSRACRASCAWFRMRPRTAWSIRSSRQADSERLRPRLTQHGGIPSSLASRVSTAYADGFDRLRPAVRVCVIPDTRGPSRSRPVEALAADVGRLGRAGFRNCRWSSFGLDRWDLDRLRRSSICARAGPGAGRRLVPARFARADGLPACGRRPHRAVWPIRHAPPPAAPARERLRARGHAAPVQDIDLYRDLVNLICTRLPNAAIGADLIAGFPGETAAEFET